MFSARTTILRRSGADFLFNTIQFNLKFYTQIELIGEGEGERGKYANQMN